MVDLFSTFSSNRYIYAEPFFGPSMVSYPRPMIEWFSPTHQSIKSIGQLIFEFGGKIVNVSNLQASSHNSF